MNDVMLGPIDRVTPLALIAVRGGDPVLNAAVRSDLTALFGEPVSARFDKMFCDRVREMVVVLRAGVERAVLATEMHSLIGLAGNIGCFELMGLARDLSDDLRRCGAVAEPAICELISAAVRAVSAVELDNEAKVMRAL
jgi:hypothetical protein